MSSRKSVFIASGVMAASAIIAGGLLAVAYGFQPPPWLLRAEVAAFSGLALLFGFTAAGRALLPWLRLRSIQGALLVCLGVAAIFVPTHFIASAVFLAMGVKLVWLEACRQADEERAAGAAKAERAEVVKAVPASHPARLPERSNGEPAVLRRR